MAVLICKKTGNYFLLLTYSYEKNWYQLEGSQVYAKYTLRKGVNLGKHLKNNYEFAGIL